MAGYSGTPLAKKLGFKEGCRVRIKNAPDDYLDLVSPRPENVFGNMLCSLIGDLKIAEVVDLPHVLVTMHIPKNVFASHTN